MTEPVWPAARLRNRDCNQGHFDLEGSAWRALKAAGAPKEVVAQFRAEMRDQSMRDTYDTIRRWMQIDAALDRWMTRSVERCDAFVAAHGGPAPIRGWAQ